MIIPFDISMYLLFVKTYKAWYNIFEMDLAIEIQLYLPFDPPTGPQGVGSKKTTARPILVSNSHTKFGWIYSNGSRGDNGRTERRLQYPLRFLKLEFRELDVSPSKTEVKQGKFVECIPGEGLFWRN